MVATTDAYRRMLMALRHWRSWELSRRREFEISVVYTSRKERHAIVQEMSSSYVDLVRPNILLVGILIVFNSKVTLNIWILKRRNFFFQFSNFMKGAIIICKTMGLRRFYSSFFSVTLGVSRQLAACLLLTLCCHIFIETINFFHRDPTLLPTRVTIYILQFLTLVGVLDAARIVKIELSTQSRWSYYVGKIMLKAGMDCMFAFVLLKDFHKEGERATDLNVDAVKSYCSKVILLLFSLDGACKFLYRIFEEFETIFLPPTVFFLKFKLTMYCQVLEIFARCFYLCEFAWEGVGGAGRRAMLTVAAMGLSFLIFQSGQRERSFGKAFWQKLSKNSVKHFEDMFRMMEPSVAKMERKKEVLLKEERKKILKQKKLV